ncbi:MAG TPA: ROK family protein [Anaerolineaceae bacterium]|nr:ROK family protein [Anaerolineaceae bacterium]
MIRLGIDIGGSAIKAALVNLDTGEIVSDTLRAKNNIETKPHDAAANILRIMRKLDYSGPLGVGFPGRLVKNVLHKAPNLHPEWLNNDLTVFFEENTKSKTVVLNDADAAALAELNFGDPRIKTTTRAMFLTLGTGIGSALILNGQIWNDTEFGQLIFEGKRTMENVGAAAVKRIENLSWKQWGIRLNSVLEKYDFYFSPELFVLGGAISSSLDKFKRYLDFPEEKVIAAKLGNDAGIIGAAMAIEKMS